MDETANEIEEHIERTRARIGSNLKELGDRVEAVTDWREHYRRGPQFFLGVAFVAGAMLANALRTRSSGEEQGDLEAPRRAIGRSAAPTQALELWNNIQGALMGVAGARIKEYISGLVPGFDEHYRRVENRSSAFDSAPTSYGPNH